MITTFTYGLLAILVLIPVAIAVFWGLLRLMDIWLKADFNDDIFPFLKKEPLSLSIYLSARLLAVAYITGAIVGRFI